MAISDTEKIIEERSKELQNHITSLERLQLQQSEDNRASNRLQKTAERYLAKRQLLLSRKDECNRNTRDLGVLPEEAFKKYTSENLDRVGVYWSI